VSSPLLAIFVHSSGIHSTNMYWRCCIHGNKRNIVCFCPICAVLLPQIQSLIRFFFWDVLIPCYFIVFYACLLLKYYVVITFYGRFRTILAHFTALFQAFSLSAFWEYSLNDWHFSVYCAFLTSTCKIKKVKHEELLMWKLIYTEPFRSNIS
jgi:hypothetical protein